MTESDPRRISSLRNPLVKRTVKLRQRSHRDEFGLMIIEGYREVKRALDNRHVPSELFFCSEFFQGRNEPALLKRCRQAGTRMLECTGAVFGKLSYRDRPDGLLAVASQVRGCLDSLKMRGNPLLVIAESIEKPGNLGTIVRSADAAGVDALIVCDRCTDINSPNVVRASIGTIFAVPVVEAATDETIRWLAGHSIRALAASPHAETVYTDTDMTPGTAIVVGAEQYGLSRAWLESPHLQTRIPMMGQSDSLNVATAATILLYEAVRQRSAAKP
jgi:TrmH family RNA methyltransferase